MEKILTRQHTVENFQLRTPWGDWTSCTHRRWTWYHDEETNCLKKMKDPNTEFYFPAGNARTRSSSQYVKIGTEPEELNGKPASVQVLEGTGVKLRCSRPPLTAKSEDPSDFWDYLTRQGGNWMREGLANKYMHHHALTWLVLRGTQNGYY